MKSNKDITREEFGYNLQKEIDALRNKQSNVVVPDKPHQSATEVMQKLQYMNQGINIVAAMGDLKRLEKK